MKIATGRGGAADRATPRLEYQAAFGFPGLRS